MKVLEYIPEFKKRIDKDAGMIGTFGHPPYSVIMYNRMNKVTYYLHYIEEFWKSFGRYYPQIGGYGISVAKEELIAGKTNSKILGETYYTVVAMPNKKQGIVFYGIKSDEWHDYCERNMTWNHHTSGNLINGSIPARFIKNMEMIPK